MTKSSPAWPGADTVRQKQLRHADIPLSANSLAVTVCLCAMAVMVFKLDLAVDASCPCHEKIFSARKA